MPIHIIDLRTEEGQKEHQQLEDGSARAWKENAIEAMRRFAEFRFTADGRFYAMAVDGETIGHHMNANNAIVDFTQNQYLWNELRAIAGAIVICDDAHGDEGELLTYLDQQELIDAWRELHRISGVAMSDADAERLEEYDEYEDEDDGE